jgi:hypothetical protein
MHIGTLLARKDERMPGVMKYSTVWIIGQRDRLAFRPTCPAYASGAYMPG